ncbi:hypothetical protein BFP71_07685 [Roseivirga misakiensis]|uniref:Thioredoxin domain-containing protein n=2 Tax=Roseivirga misakiensis TaxID=1563681 RepID=A0A1E5SK07_9BACT|nr:hypothetical protein BFP71_07685 [Roseivirga misakiensis]
MTASPIFAQIVTKNIVKSQIPAGQEISQLTFESIIQGPEKNAFNNDLLKGKVVMLEFWGTWCAPCIKHFPKLNDLATSFSEEGFVIISITDEAEEIVRPFLKRRPLNTWVVSDTDRSVIDDFGVNVFPTTVIIDKNGKVHEYVKIDDIDKDYIKGLIESTSSPEKVSFNLNDASQPKKGVQKIQFKGASSQESKAAPTYSLSITKDSTAKFEGGILGKKMGLIDMKGWSVRKAIANAFNISQTLVEGNEELLNTKLNVKLNMPRHQEELVNMLLKEGLKKELGLTIKPQEKEIELLVLSAPNGLSKYLKAPKSTKGKFSADDGVIAGRHWTLNSLIKNIEATLGESVFDDTQLSERYDYDLYWDHNDPQSINEALKEQLGLVLEKKIKKVESLTVEKAVTKS